MVQKVPPNKDNCDKILSKLSSIENRLQLIENETPSNETINEPNISLDTYKKCQAYARSQENDNNMYESSLIERIDDDEE